ncbi:MAG: CotH kinase family protein [Sphingobacteriales bacterium]|nr:CotH kinase family protein [Sphingobacteriales bacterium]
MKRLFLPVIGCLLAAVVSGQTLNSSNLPIIVINTNGQEIVDDPKITADMGIIYNGEGVRNAVTDPFNHYNGKIGIEIRGQSSQMFPMKSYSLELWDNSGNSLDKSLFGLPKESDWVLYAPYTDKTLMRNFLAYTMSRELGHWAANCRYVEVVVNGDYKGIYVFMEKIKRGSGRVPVSKIGAADISGDAVTGGYIFSIDKEADAWYSFVYPPYGTNGQNIRFAYVYPKLSSIVAAQQNYLKNYVDSFETALNGDQYQDKQNGWRRFADEASFIDYLIVNEVSRNVDSYRLSAYFNKDRRSKGGKIFAGPVWDYDLAFRNADYCKGPETRGWAYHFNKDCPQDYWQIPFWWYQFEKDSAFQSNLRCRWKQVRQASLSDGRIYNLIDSIVTLTAEAQQRHFQRWPVLGQYIWPNPQPIPTSYAGEIVALKEWISARISWISSNIPNAGPCYDYPASETVSILAAFYPNPVGDRLTLDIKSRLAQKVMVRITDVMGRTVLNQACNLHYGENYIPVAAGRWAPGVYILSYQADSGEKGTQKLLKQ